MRRATLSVRERAASPGYLKAFPAAGLALPAAAWTSRLSYETRLVLILIGFGTALRLVFAGLTGLGIDESYMAATRGSFALGYFDHPPLSWWLCAAAARLTGSGSPLALRFPFVLLAALTTWLIFRLGVLLFSARAGLFGAVGYSLSPLFSLTSGCWILPDGPLNAALAGCALCLAQALQVGADRRPSALGAGRMRVAAGWWLGAGLCGGLAMLSKYSAALVLCGAAGFLLTDRHRRRQLRSAAPWVAVGILFLLASPILVWNAQHDWMSFAFQGSRALGGVLRPAAPLIELGGNALFVLPWIWGLMLVAVIRGLCLRPLPWQTRLLLCCAAPPILLFALVGIWSRRTVMFHWAAPGYLMLFPLLGQLLAQAPASCRRVLPLACGASGALLVLSCVVMASELRWAWMPLAVHDPCLDGIDWTSLRTQLHERRPAGPGATKTLVGATRWHDAGKLDYALGDAATVLCLGGDPREFGVLRPLGQYAGRDVLILSPRATLAAVRRKFGAQFDGIDQVRPFHVDHAGRPILSIPAFVGHRLHSPAARTVAAGAAAARV